MMSSSRYKITLLADYLEDSRYSMNYYADSLFNNLKLNSINLNFIFELYLPFFPKWVKYFLRNISAFRYARYISYPKQVFLKRSDLFHILDQSYAYLLNFIYQGYGIVTVHDLIPILSWKGLIPGVSYPHPPRLFMLGIRALNKARAVVAVSESTKRDLVNHCGIDPSRIHVIHNGISTNFYPLDNSPDLRSCLGFPNDGTKLVLITGTQKYKNHLTSVRAIDWLEEASKIPIQLIWVGGAGCSYDSELSDAIFKLKTKPIMLGHVSAKELNEIYNCVDFLLFPSWYEGFGWPPLEAMACGLPVITSNVSSLPEVVGDAAIMLDPSDYIGFGNAIKLLIEDDALRRFYISKGYLNIRRFSWKNSSLKLLELYKKVLNK